MYPLKMKMRNTYNICSGWIIIVGPENKDKKPKWRTLYKCVFNMQKYTVL